MTASNAVRFLSDGETDYGLNLTENWGAMLSQFYKRTLFYDNTGNVGAYKNITQGKSHQFIQVSEDPTPENFTPGTQLLGQDYAFDDGTITVDDILVAHFDVPVDQKMLSHFDVMQPLMTKLGRSLAIQCDERLARMLTLSARTASKADYHNGGNVVERVGASVAAAYPTSSAGAENFRGDVAELARLMDEDNVPEEGRVLFTTPYICEVLGYSDRVLNKDYIDDTLPNSLLRRVIGQIEGFTVLKTNSIPTADDSSNTALPSKYRGDFSLAGSTGQPVALAATGSAGDEKPYGVVEAMQPTLLLYEDPRRMTTFMRAAMMIGADVLSPYTAGEIYVDDA